MAAAPNVAGPEQRTVFKEIVTGKNVHGQSPDSAYLHQLEGVDFEPVFVLGNHRSGTTLLYQLLEATGEFNLVRAYHIVRRDNLLADSAQQRTGAAREQIGQRLAAADSYERAFDHVTVSADLPEEYGFILPGGRPRLHNSNVEILRQLGKKIQYLAGNEKPLLLKNPWDFANFLYIRKTFPNAKFVFIHRNPVHVINSQIVSARALYREINPYHALLDDDYATLWSQPVRLRFIRLLFSKHLQLGFRVCLRSVQRATQYFLDNCACLGNPNYTEVTYEQLCSRPEESIGSILRFLGLAGRISALSKVPIKPRTPVLLDEVRKNIPLIFARLEAYCAHCGYRKDEIQFV